MEPLESTLRKFGQKNLLEQKLSPSLIDELQALDWEQVGEAIHLIQNPRKKTSSFKPLDISLQPTIRHPAQFLQGKRLGCLVMAGGQATRLNGVLPKGLIPVSPQTHKPALQMIAEKVAAFSSSYNAPCYLGIMTSQATHEKIFDYFSSNDYFGLHERQVSFFQQSSLPALDDEGQLIIKNGSLFMVPDGNGGIFRAFSPLYTSWQKAGVSLLSIINTDNPLIDPFLPNLFEPLLHGAEMTAATVERTSPDESVGLFVRQGDKISVQEYSEINPEVSQERTPDGNLSLRWANISFLACTLNACKSAARHTLPLHMAKKTLHGLSFWKAEYFIFDHFPLIPSFKVVPIARDFFAPIKTLTGPSSPEGVGKALEARDKKLFFELCKKDLFPQQELPEELYYRGV